MNMERFNEALTKLNSELFIDDSTYYNLNQCFKSHSAAHMNWIRLAANASKEEAALRLELKILTAQISNSYRQKHLEETGKPLAISFDIKGEILPLNEEWVEVNKKINDIVEVREIAQGASQDFSNRVYLLKEVASYVKSTNSDFAKFQSSADKLMKEVEELPKEDY